MNLLDKIKSIFNIESGESKHTNGTATADVSSYESNSSDASDNGAADTEDDSSDTEAEPARETLAEVEEAEPHPDASEEHTVDGGGEAVATAGVDTESGGETDAQPETRTDVTMDADTTTDVDADAGVDETQTEEGAETDEGAEAEPQTDTETASEAETIDSEPVNVIKGVGATYAERLGEAGIETVDELAAADPEAVADETNISAKRIERWVGRAEHR